MSWLILSGMLAESDNMKTNKLTHNSRKEAPTVLFSERSFKTELSEVQLVQIESGQWKGQTGKYCCYCSPEKNQYQFGVLMLRGKKPSFWLMCSYLQKLFLRRRGGVGWCGWLLKNDMVVWGLGCFINFFWDLDFNVLQN